MVRRRLRHGIGIEGELAPQLGHGTVADEARRHGVARRRRLRPALPGRQAHCRRMRIPGAERRIHARPPEFGLWVVRVVRAPAPPTTRSE
jgi:hypothetical protein